MNKLPKDSLWKEFKFTDIFNIKCGFYNKKPNSEKNGKIPFIGATEYNNGITEFYSYENILNTSKTGKEPNESIERKIFPGNCLCVTNNGSVGFAYYQKIPFTCTHDVNPLYLKDYKLNKYIAMFLIATIEKQRVCFMYARKWRPCRMVKSKLLLPVNLKGEPDYKFMEEYIKERETRLKNQYKEQVLKRVKQLQAKINGNRTWGEFRIKDIFPTLVAGKSKGLNHLEQVEQGGIAYLGATNRNNGVLCFVKKAGNEKLIQKGNCVAFIRNGEGSMGYSIYKAENFIATSDITLGYNNKINKYSGMFITTIADRVRGKYSFNYKRSDTRLKKEILSLPVDSKGEPDYEFMQNYMLYLEQKKILEYLEYVDE